MIARFLLFTNKPFECRSTVIPLPSFPPMLQKSFFEGEVWGTPVYAEKGGPLMGNWGNHGNRKYYRRAAQQEPLYRGQAEPAT
jgi:hypothetical protein